MISRDNENFVVRHYDWIVAGVGAVAVLAAVGFFVLSLGADADAAAADAVRSLDARKSAKTAVESQDLTAYGATLRRVKNPIPVAAIDSRRESFLASERRVKCLCGAVMTAGLTNCPSCKASLIIVNKEDEAAKEANRWATRYGVKADDTDKDGDGFTNAEEYAAKTDPTDAKSHPDYVDSLKLALPLKETHVPFVLTKATQIPTGWRCEFFDPKRKDDYGRLGRTFTAIVGEEICVPVNRATGAAKDEPTGYLLKSFERKEERRAITAGSTMKKAVDVSVATVERKSDGRKVDLVMQAAKKGAKLSPIDVQATLVYERMGTKSFNVVAGDEIALNGEKHRIVSIKGLEKSAEVVIENTVTGKKSTLKALE